MENIQEIAYALKAAQEQLSEIKETERILRIQLADAIDLESKKIGMNKIEAGDLVIKATRKVNYSLDSDTLDIIWDTLSPEEQECVKYKPSLSLAAYKKIDHETLDEAIEVKPAMPAIQVLYQGE